MQVRGWQECLSIAHNFARRSVSSRHVSMPGMAWKCHSQHFVIYFSSQTTNVSITNMCCILSGIFRESKVLNKNKKYLHFFSFPQRVGSWESSRASRRPMASSTLKSFWNHPAGPKTIHFWAPTFKWGIAIANIADFSKPPEKVSYPQQIAVTATGLIWSRYSTVITPKNWNLLSVNVFMAATGIYQLSRKIKHDYAEDQSHELEKA